MKSSTPPTDDTLSVSGDPEVPLSKYFDDELSTAKNTEAQATQKDASRSTKDSLTKPAKPHIETIEELLTEAFESKHHMLVLTQEELLALPISDEQLPAQQEAVTILTKADPQLNGPFKLLQFVASQGVPLGRNTGAPIEPILERLRDLAVFALGQHPVFGIWTEELRDPRGNPELTEERVLNRISGTTHYALGISKEKFQALGRTRLRRNSITSLGLLRVLQHDWNIDRFIDAQAPLWSADVPIAISPEKAASFLTASRDCKHLGLIVNSYEARVNAHEKEIAQLRIEAETTTRRIAFLEEQQRHAQTREESLIAQGESLSADIVRLQKELAAERDNRVVDKSHMSDDYETLRTRVIRRLGGEIDLLTDALHALRNGAAPVAEEFLDRSLLALSREVEQLKDTTGGTA